MRKTLEERFWQKVDKSGDCWEWTAGKISGYGSFRISADVGVRAHRQAWEMLRGPIPEGLQIDHLCRNRACVNPDHLEPVTQRENLRRGMGPAAVNARKERCHMDHEPNWYVTRAGRRQCRDCGNLRGRKYKQQRRDRERSAE